MRYRRVFKSFKSPHDAEAVLAGDSFLSDASLALDGLIELLAEHHTAKAPASNLDHGEQTTVEEPTTGTAASTTMTAAQAFSAWLNCARKMPYWGK